MINSMLVPNPKEKSFKKYPDKIITLNLFQPQEPGKLHPLHQTLHL